MECCIDFESLTRRSIESLALHKSFSTNLMQHTGPFQAWGDEGGDEDEEAEENNASYVGCT